MKSFTDLFIRRPVLAMVVSFVILIAGLQAMKNINVRQYPRSDIAAITVSTVYVGADAELVRGFITTPLERAIAAADGIDYIQSQSKQSSSLIRARLKLNYDANKALSDISSKVDAIRRDLPPESEIPVINIEAADSQFASAYLSFSSNILQPNEVTDYLVRLVQPRLTAVGGVQKADILGGRTFAMRIWMKPDRMAALNISPTDVRTALARNNYLSAVGSTKGSLLQVNLTANTDLHTADDFKKLVVRQDKGNLVRLSDIADVVLGAEDYNTEVRFSGEKAVFMGIWVLPNANSIDVIKRVRVEMEQIQKELPTGMTGQIAYDATAYINDAIHEVVKTLIDTLLIVMVVIFLFLGSIRSVVVPIVAIPISLIGALFLMQVFGFTLNLLTLLAIVLSVGLVVDDAIVVVENVERHLREGLSRTNAALLGARELIGPIIAMTITLAAVYTPIALQGGLTGALFREFALTLAGAVFISGVVALTLSPMMSANLLRAGDADKGFSGVVNRTFDRFRDWYGSHLDRTLQRAAGGLCGVGGAVAPGGPLLPAVAEGTGADGRSRRHLRHHDRAGQRDHRRHDPLRRRRRKNFPRYSGHAVHLSTHLSRQRFRRNGAEAVGRPQNADRSLSPGGAGKTWSHPRNPNVSGHALRSSGRRQLPGELRHYFDGRPRAHSRVRAANSNEGDAGRHFSVRRRRYEDRSAAV